MSESFFNEVALSKVPYQEVDRLDNSEWLLGKNFLCSLCIKLGTPGMALFASRVSHQLPKHKALSLDSYSKAPDALSVLWSWKSYYPVDIYLLKVNNRNTRTRCELCSKLTKTPERCQWRCSGVFIVNSELFHILF